MAYVSDVPVVERMLNRERYELEVAWYDFWSIHEDTLNALEDVLPALQAAGWTVEGDNGVPGRLQVAAENVDIALGLNGYTL